MKNSRLSNSTTPPYREQALHPADSRKVSRRGFLKSFGTGGAMAAAVGVGLGPQLLVSRRADATEWRPVDPFQRRNRSLALRREAALSQYKALQSLQANNGDEFRYADRRANFFKTLPQDDLGEVDPTAYAILLEALELGEPRAFEEIPLSPSAERKLANPQAAYGFEMVGLDGHMTRIAPPPAFSGAEQAVEMAEVYWQALTRDVPFRDYTTDPLIADAVSDLNAFQAADELTVHRSTTPANIFRGETPGDLAGPYLSQFLWLPVTFGLFVSQQTFQLPLPGSDFLTDYGEWLAIQRGASPTQNLPLDSVPRFIANGRDLGEYVHRDVTFQAYLNAALIMLSMGRDALASQNPYRDSINQGGFVSFGTADIMHMVTMAANVSLHGAWYQKWLIHRRLRPEVFAARIELQLSGVKDYGIHSDILACAALERVRQSNGNGLLPQAYPEGSPTHPSYPAGHACIAGACATILKAFFDEAFVIPNPMQALPDGSALEAWTGDDLTLGNEINKLAANISLGRDTAGVHYRSDGIQGILQGEQQALGILQDYSRTYNEEFDGFILTRFNGSQIRIANGRLDPMG